MLLLLSCPDRSVLLPLSRCAVCTGSPGLWRRKLCVRLGSAMSACSCNRRLLVQRIKALNSDLCLPLSMAEGLQLPCCHRFLPLLLCSWAGLELQLCRQEEQSPLFQSCAPIAVGLELPAGCRAALCCSLSPGSAGERCYEGLS